MASHSENAGNQDEIKTQFITREGTYRLLTLCEYSRPNRVGYANAQGSGCSPPVKISFATITSDIAGSNCDINLLDRSFQERITFNYGRELFVYPYRGIRKATEVIKPVDKRVYKGTCPTCHDFGVINDLTEVPLLIGFSGGQIQLIDPVHKEFSKLYNEERFIDKSKVTCIKWIPDSVNQFLASHASGNMYLYSQELVCSMTAPVYQLFKAGNGFSIYTCKTKSTRNPLYKWTLGSVSTSPNNSSHTNTGSLAINEFAFSPCGAYIAVVSQDGYLRIWHYHSMDQVGQARSFFGGWLCVCWSPDSKYIVVGGEDDLITIYGFHERRVILRGQGHKSWVSQVSFDPWNMSYGDVPDGADFSGSDDENPAVIESHQMSVMGRNVHTSNLNSAPANITCYRLGSIGQDTCICFWDITENILKQQVPTFQTTALKTSGFSNGVVKCNSTSPTTPGSAVVPVDSNNSPIINPPPSISVLTQKFSLLGFGKSLANNEKTQPARADVVGGGGGPRGQTESVILGSAQCPRIKDIPLIDPAIIKKISNDRLTSLVFKEDCLVTSCQDGYIYTWARPGKLVNNGTNQVASSTNTSLTCPGSPPPSIMGLGGGTIV